MKTITGRVVTYMKHELPAGVTLKDWGFALTRGGKAHLVQVLARHPGCGCPIEAWAQAEWNVRSWLMRNVKWSALAVLDAMREPCPLCAERALHAPAPRQVLPVPPRLRIERVPPPPPRVPLWKRVCGWLS